MLWMNDWEIEEARTYWNRRQAPNLARASRVLEELARWTNNNSDGWPYWAKPARAAQKIMEILYSDHAEDIPDTELKSALRPIKSFLTRQGINHSEIPSL